MLSRCSELEAKNSFRPASDGSYVVTELVRDGGAEISGVLIGDVIIAVEDRMVSTLTTSQLVKYIKGPADTFVQVRERVGLLFLLLPPHSTITTTTCCFLWIRSHFSDGIRQNSHTIRSPVVDF
jgi:hypothetical protein